MQLFNMRFTLLFFLITIISCTQHKKSGENEELLIEYIAHASFKLVYKDHSILLDPFADHIWIGYDFPKNIMADAVFSTHPHYDHDGGLFRGLHPYWEGKIPLYQDPGIFEIEDFKVTGLKGKHCDPYGKEFGQKNTIWIIEAAGLRLVHWGDNGPITDSLALELKNVDVLMVPIDDEEHILKNEELNTVLQRINPKIIIPMHYKIAELEKEEGKPQDLGTIDNYLKGKSNVKFLKRNFSALSIEVLPASPQYWVFKHSPLVKPAEESEEVSMPKKQ